MLLHLPIGDRYFDFAMRPVFDQHGAVPACCRKRSISPNAARPRKRLRQSQKMEAVGQLTGGVAHDFNNLLTIIRSATDFLRRRELPEERRRRYIDAISDTVDRASKLTGQLLAFARRQPLTPEVFDVGLQVEGIAQLIRPLVGGQNPDRSRNPRSRMFRDGRHRTIRDLPDQSRRQQPGCHATAKVLFRSRSRRPMPSRRRAPARSATESSLRSRWRKPAPAFRPKSSRHLRAVLHTKEVGKGTGLGLSQALGFAKQSGGEIVVGKRLGEGSTFTIYLPQAAAPVRQAEMPARILNGDGQRPRPSYPGGGRQRGSRTVFDRTAAGSGLRHPTGRQCADRRWR